MSFSPPTSDVPRFRLSLVIPTYACDRRTFDRCVSGIVAQRFPNLEVIVVDQDAKPMHGEAIERLSTVADVIHLRLPPAGAAAARNAGARVASGTIISFPDDDSWYPEGLLRRVDAYFSEHLEIVGLTGATFDEDGGTGNGRFLEETADVTLENAWITSIEFTLFLRRDILLDVGFFCEDIGAGARTRFLAGEGTELVMRIIEKGHRLRFDPTVKVGHPRTDPTATHPRKAFGYGLGMGLVARRMGTPIKPLLSLLVRPAGGVLLSLIRLRPKAAQFYALTGAGRALGYVWYGRRGGPTEVGGKHRERRRHTAP